MDLAEDDEETDSNKNEPQLQRVQPHTKPRTEKSFKYSSKAKNNRMVSNINFQEVRPNH